jgi:hypothetical protein
MSELFSVDLGSTLPYLEDKIRQLFGKDPDSLRAREILAKQVRLAVRDAATVQIVGMDRPVAIDDIYQSTHLINPRTEAEVDVSGMVDEGSSAVIFGKPGAGKTVFLSRLFATLSRSRDTLPILFTLRRENVVEDLLWFTAKAVAKEFPFNTNHLVLLVDGYDEVPTRQRQRISEALRYYQAHKRGPFYLTCRSHYPVDDTGASHLEIGPFNHEDAKRFVVAFSRVYQAPIDETALIEELIERGFRDFIAHPLLLTLVCILKAGSLPALPRTAIGLVRRAVDTLTFRWDEAKGISRESDSKLPLDGEDRVRGMMHVAHAMERYIESDTLIQSVIKDYLKLIQQPRVSSARLLDEIAQWYGMLVPVAGDAWSFTHRVVHDFLAARYWVESGSFDPGQVTIWNARAAYAACLLPDATVAIETMLARSNDIAAFVECLYNNARFDVARVARALVRYFSDHTGYHVVDNGETVIADTRTDLFRVSSDELILAIARFGVQHPLSEPHAVGLWFSAYELMLRGLGFPKELSVLFENEYGERTLRIKRHGAYYDITMRELLLKAGA